MSGSRLAVQGSVAGSWYVAGAPVDGFGLAPEALGRSGVEDGGAARRGQGGHLVGAGQAVGRPGRGRERGLRPLARRAGLERRRPRPQAAVEQGGVAAEHAQHPHEPPGGAAARVVVGDDRVVVADAGGAHRLGEGLGRRQGVAPGGAVAAAREVTVEVDEHGARDVAGLEGGPARPSVEVPTDVGHDDLVAMVPPATRSRPGGRGTVPSTGTLPTRWLPSRLDSHTGLTVSVDVFQSFFAILALAALLGAVVLARRRPPPPSGAAGRADRRAVRRRRPAAGLARGAGVDARQPLLLRGGRLHPLHAVLVPTDRDVPAGRHPRHRHVPPRPRHQALCRARWPPSAS